MFSSLLSTCFIIKLLFKGVTADSLVKGECFAHDIIDVHVETNNYGDYWKLLGVKTDFASSLSEAAPLHNFPGVSSAYHYDLKVCYYANIDYSHYFTTISSMTYPHYYLVLRPGGSQAMYKYYGDLDVDNTNDPRLLVNELLLSVSMAKFKAKLSSGVFGYLHGSGGNVGYRSTQHWWYLLPYSVYTGTDDAQLFIYWYTNGGNRRKRASLSDSEEDCCYDPDGYYVRFSRNGRIVFQKHNSKTFTCVQQLGRRIQARRYTVYTEIAGGNISNPLYKTRNACTITERRTDYSLAPLLKHGNLLVTGNWSASNDSVPYGEMGIVDYDCEYRRFRQISKFSRVLEPFQSKQRYLDSRFFYVDEIAGRPGFYHLELANQKGYYMAALSVGRTTKLVATLLKEELPGVITYAFHLNLPKATRSTSPPQITESVQANIMSNSSDFPTLPIFKPS